MNISQIFLKSVAGKKHLGAVQKKHFLKLAKALSEEIVQNWVTILFIIRRLSRKKSIGWAKDEKSNIQVVLLRLSSNITSLHIPLSFPSFSRLPTTRNPFFK